MTHRGIKKQVLTNLKEQVMKLNELNVQEMNENELRIVEGGVAPGVIIAAGGLYLAAVGGVYKAGHAIGKAYYYWSH